MDGEVDRGVMDVDGGGIMAEAREAEACKNLKMTGGGREFEWACDLSEVTVDLMDRRRVTGWTVVE